MGCSKMNAKQAYNTSFENENIVNYVEKEISGKDGKTSGRKLQINSNNRNFT